MKYLLTTVHHFPVIIACKTTKDVQKHATRNSVLLSKDTFEANIASGRWSDTTNRHEFYVMLEQAIPKLTCWALMEDAIE